MRRTLLTVLTASVGALFALPVSAQDPYMKADDSWISISGTVSSVMEDRFTLDYGEGLITVEMDDWDAHPEALVFKEGDKVTVNGVIDDDLFETTTIEASAVYVESLDSYFWANAADEEDAFVALPSPIVISRTTVQGRVVSVLDDEFTIATGLSTLTVDVSDLGYDPLDEMGYQRIDVGDRVSVTGTLLPDFFEGRELKADVVVTLAETTS